MTSKRFKTVFFNAAFLSCTVFSTAVTAQDLYGFLLIKPDGYSLSKDITSDPRFPLFDTFGNGLARDLNTTLPGYIKFKLASLKPAASVECSSGTPGKTRCERREVSSSPWEKTTCRSDTHFQGSFVPCSSYQKAKQYFINIGPMRNDFAELTFDKSAFAKTLNATLMAAGLDTPFGEGVGSVWWDKRIVELKGAIAQNHGEEEAVNTAITTKIKAAEETGFGKFQGLTPYEPFSYKRKSESLPSLLGNLQEYKTAQTEARQVYEKEVLANFDQYFVPKQAEAERTYPALLAQKKATDLAQEKAQKAAQAEQVRLADNEVKRIAAFRKTIKIEGETNCGPVLALKVNLIQIYFPVNGYGNEHWIRRNDLYPAGYSCKFVNGSYVGTGNAN